MKLTELLVTTVILALLVPFIVVEFDVLLKLVLF